MQQNSTKNPAESLDIKDGAAVIPVEVIRMRRKTITVSVKDDGSVTLKCPPGLPKRELDRFLAEKHDWIVKHYSDVMKRQAVYRDVIDFKAVLINGQPRPLVFGQNPGIYPDRAEIRFREDIEDVFLDAYGQKLMDYAWELADRFGVHPKSIAVKGYKSRWGCCDADGNIRLNYALMMLTRNEQTLVILHEFCHLFHMDHSRAFHALLDKWYPANRRVQKRLNSFSFLLRLYN
ncbi:MAG: M48 family metallopeptidase [Clostridia bacterium]|nr:M48 family metallopeptidase [Clostridia bacterium]